MEFCICVFLEAGCILVFFVFFYIGMFTHLPPHTYCFLCYWYIYTLIDESYLENSLSNGNIGYNSVCYNILPQVTAACSITPTEDIVHIT